ncbi:hypothetical protein J4G08_13670 [Candidatus Poribacteria bacterium]|nr:hypothetical protein [Candidatus Poribacteria bacterium]
MRQHYKAFLTLIIISTLVITSGLLLFGTYDATQTGTQDCEQRIKSDCVTCGERPIVRTQPHAAHWTQRITRILYRRIVR